MLLHFISKGGFHQKKCVSVQNWFIRAFNIDCVSILIAIVILITILYNNSIVLSVSLIPICYVNVFRRSHREISNHDSQSTNMEEKRMD